MENSSARLRVISIAELSRLHWRYEILVHTLFGVPLILLAVFAWGFGVDTIARAYLLYAGIYISIYVPYYYFLPRIALRSIRTDLQRLSRGEHLAKPELLRVVEELLRYPLTVAKVDFVFILPGYTLATWLIYFGIIPEFVPFQGIISVFVLFCGVIITISECLLNYIGLEERVRQFAEDILDVYPTLDFETIPVQRIPLFFKLFLFATLNILLAEFSLLGFFLSDMAIVSPLFVMKGMLFSASFVASSMVYILILTPKFSNTITMPFARLVAWSRGIINGNLHTSLRLVTNDEITEVAHNVGQMVTMLQETTAQVRKDTTELKIEKDKLITILGGIKDGVVALDAKHRVVLVNNSAQSLLHILQNEVYGMLIDEVITLQDEHGVIVHIGEQLAHQVTTNTPFAGDSFSVLRDQYETKNISISTRVIYGLDKHPTLFIMTIHDRTEEIKLEDMKLDFVSMAAHELRTPLTSIRGYLSVILMQAQNLTEEQIAFLRRSEYSTVRLTLLIENLLSISKIERGIITLMKAPVSWVEFLEALVEQMQINAKSKQITLVCVKPAQAIPEIQVDAVRISEVVNNLITNAITYTPEGGQIWVSVEMLDHEIITHVKDTGTGIPDDARSHLFTKFFRVKRGLEEGVHGIGVGLYMAKAIVAMHGGKIWAETQVNQGSTFSFSLPL